MSDRELMELAAKAAGLKFAINGDGQPGYVAARNGDWRYGWGYWNPLHDDGDALRLAIKTGTNVFTGMAENKTGRHFATEAEIAADPCAATRRAIVRAAAEIGKAMQ